MEVPKWQKSGKQPAHKPQCYAKHVCLDLRSNNPPAYGKLLLPVCPVLQEKLRDRPLYDISKIPETNLPLLNSVKRVLAVLGKLSNLQPNIDNIVLCAHTKDTDGNRNFLTEWLNPINDDLETLPKAMERDFPQTSTKLRKLIRELKEHVNLYGVFGSKSGVYLLPPEHCLDISGLCGPTFIECWDSPESFLIWRKQLNSQFGRLDKDTANRVMGDTYPIGTIMASRPICKELTDIAKILEQQTNKTDLQAVQKASGGKAEDKKNKEIPSDLIDLAKAVGLYHRSRAQIKRDIDDGKIKDYRKIQNGKHWISKKEADNLYIPK